MTPYYELTRVNPTLRGFTGGGGGDLKKITKGMVQKNVF